MIELIEFLRARLAEDEALARGAEGGKGPHGYFAVTDWAYFDTDFGDLLRSRRVNDSDAWQPSRVLRDVAAKRAILDGFEYPGVPGPWDGCGDDCEYKAVEWVIRHLATVYDQHPDYRQEWAP